MYFHQKEYLKWNRDIIWCISPRSNTFEINFFLQCWNYSLAEENRAFCAEQQYRYNKMIKLYSNYKQMHSTLLYCIFNSQCEDLKSVWNYFDFHYFNGSEWENFEQRNPPFCLGRNFVRISIYYVKKFQTKQTLENLQTVNSHILTQSFMYLSNI